MWFAAYTQRWYASCTRARHGEVDHGCVRERLEHSAGHVRDEELHAVLWPAVRAELRRELERHARTRLVRTHAAGRSHASVWANSDE